MACGKHDHPAAENTGPVAGPSELPEDFDRLNRLDGERWVELALRGDLDGAWRLSDRILRRHAGRPCWHLPRHDQYIWDGTPIDGRRVLIRCYRGLGDTIQFVRYAPLLRQRAREVILWAQPQLLPLLEHARGLDHVLPVHDGPIDVAYDVDVEAMELPYVFRTTLSTVPSDVPYLHVEPPSMARADTLRAGIVWRAGEREPRRSVSFDLLTPLFESAGISWVSLQYAPEPSERHDRLQMFGATDDPLAVARMMKGLDLVVSVDTMAAHLAGALGVRTWTLLPAAADWRWLEERADTPWYPTMRLFRQKEPGDWKSVLQEVAGALAR